MSNLRWVGLSTFPTSPWIALDREKPETPNKKQFHVEGSEKKRHKHI